MDPGRRPFVSGSAVMKRALALLVQLIDEGTRALVTGPWGGGKTTLVRAAHDRSSRGGRPHVIFGAGEIQPTLMQSELFGHQGRAYTGANGPRLGLLRSAHLGTCLFDNVDKYDRSVQEALLRFLDDHKVRPTGSDEVYVVDTRVIAATNQDLRELSERKLFLGDLMWRLAEEVIWIPPLCERREDIAPIAERYLAFQAGAKGAAPPVIEAEAMKVFERAPWPGNVRELEHALGRAVRQANGGPITLEVAARAVGGEPPTIGIEDLVRPPLHERRRREVYLRALELMRWRVEATAEALGMNLRTFQRDCKRFGIDTRERC